MVSSGGEIYLSRKQDLDSKLDHYCLSIIVAGHPNLHILVHTCLPIDIQIYLHVMYLCMHTKKQTYKCATQLTVAVFLDKFTVSGK